ncbi:MAG TPA: TetR/AcrR family transcriptional regulator [Stackebrandtia sp.]|jgi:AcrR family transcriptional regulator|uniref:TetR/AcrR family transcriptional regulator n=1 Tax=Stackebrandtia sp. TaxID=2023065 RepID=UPI002D5626D4|nr:TetR/AcrR family transcriptional regulator [Stackebrandtia sp.]HZE41209.1 TetR/AcrR family transcriptional regulator [Stackebrandtia sp.]
MTTSNPVRRSRREEILDLAVELFAARGYHGVSMDDIGARAHITGPALYHHFKGGKEAMLAEALIPVSERLREGGREHASQHRDDPRAALRALVAFHVEFALSSPAVIAVHLHELDRLPEEPRRTIRRLQRAYVEEWVEVLRQLRPELSVDNARVLAHAAFGLMNSTPFLGRETLAERAEITQLLGEAALSALDPQHRKQDLTIV